MVIAKKEESIRVFHNVFCHSVKPTSDPDWLKHDNMEYMIVFESQMTGHDAKANCHEAGGDGLAEIHSLEDHNVLLYLATKWNYEKSLTVSQFLLGEHRHLKSQVLFKATIDGMKIKRNFATSNPVN